MSSPIKPRGGKKYLIAAAALRRDIEAGMHAIGSKLPTPDVLGERYGVSKPTMERALQMLKDEGWLIAYVGDGTYVERQSAEDGTPTEEALFSVISDQLDSLRSQISSLEARVKQLELRENLLSATSLAAVFPGCVGC